MNRDDNLIFDVGMNEGSDTAFYLAKGFRVIAVEANPALAKKAHARFAAEVNSGSLRIIAKAVGLSRGRIRFFLHRKDDWSATTRLPDWEDQDVECIEVDCVPLDDLIRDHGVPHYLKIDIEGSDLEAVRSLARLPDLPTYVSAEAHTPQVALVLHDLGYRNFKLIDQGHGKRAGLPWVPREGVYVHQTFTGLHSGPFGEETPGPWRSLDQVLADFEMANPATWYDFHATHVAGSARAADDLQGRVEIWAT
jgi:FkbM family methyltransferase